MSSEFEQMIFECNYLVNTAYYGFGIIDSAETLIVNTENETLQFQCLDLTSTALGLDDNLNIATPEDAQNAYPYVIAALETVEEAIAILDDYSIILTESLQPKKNIPAFAGNKIYNVKVRAPQGGRL